MSTAFEYPAPLRAAVKFARIVVDLASFDGEFVPWADTLPYGAEGRAECALGAPHAAPDPDCSCGFYAAYDVPELLTLLQPDQRALAGAALLNVELGGVELAGPYGVRAGEQRVLGAALVPFCQLCDSPDSPGATQVRLYGCPITTAQGIRHWVVPLCAAHAMLEPQVVALSLGDVANLVGTEVTWTDAQQAASFFDWRERQLAAGQRRGPLAAERTVGQLRMGQVGFTWPDAIRVHDGELLVDVDGPALQREHAAAFVPVMRRVDLRLEVLITRDNADAIETAVCQARALSAPRRTNPAMVRGTRHASRLNRLLRS